MSDPISVIIPVLNEAAALEKTLTALREIKGLELIVADGGSRDGTMAIAERIADRVTVCEPGRARQMNAGAGAAGGAALLFLHADTLVGREGIEEMTSALSDSSVVGGAFRLAIESRRPFLRLVAAAANWRTRVLGLPYGDQGIFVRREVFTKMGGYADLPLMEDVEFMRRLRRQGRTVVLTASAVTSARRWEKEGILRTTVRNLVLVVLYRLGVSPSRLARWYGKDIR